MSEGKAQLRRGCGRPALHALALSLALALLPAAASGQNGGPAAEPRRLIIGTDAPDSAQHAVGQAICRLLDRHQPRTIRCRAETTAGSVENLVGLRGGMLDMAIVRSDWHHHAFQGTRRFEADGPDLRLRSVLSLHREAFTILAGADSGIERLADLKGRRIAAGEHGSAHRAAALMVFRALEWSMADFALVLDDEMADRPQALCDNRADAVLITVGHPNRPVADAVAACRARLIPVDDRRITALVADTPYFEPTVIRPGLYPGQKERIVTFGTTATLVASADVAPETVYEVVRALLGNIRALRRVHPALEDLDVKRMVSEGLIAPVHEGALRYYREKDLIELVRTR